MVAVKGYQVLGLNITTRLLNIYNNLFLKMQFTCRPQLGCLTTFLNSYHIEKFKRIDKNSNTFAAEMDSIEDFDKLCAVKEMMCGEAKVTVTPCYKFTQCPENLKTIYDDTYFYEDAAQQHTSPKSKNNTQKSKAIQLNEYVIKPEKKMQKIDTKSIDNSETNPKSIDRPQIQKIANSVRNDFVVKNESPNVAKEPVTDSSKVTSVNMTPKEKDVTVNSSNKKEINKDIKKFKDVSKYSIKDKLESHDDDIEADVREYQMECDDELDDEDILALMSEGVVLDECSGSEDEN